MKEKMLADFEKIYGDSQGAKVYFAPGRVNLIGEHIDYNGGYVLPCALTLGTYGAARKREDQKIRMASLNIENSLVELDLSQIEPGPQGDWTNYVKGVVAGIRARGFELESGLDLLFFGDLPGGAGLSSSASLEVLTGFILRDIFALDLTNVDLALIGQEAEHNYCGVNCGIMDQFAVAMGQKDQAIYLNTADLSYQYVPARLEGYKLVLTNSKAKHSLADSAYNERRKECQMALKDLQVVMGIEELCQLDPETFETYGKAIKEEEAYLRARHAVGENARTKEAVKALSQGRLEDFGKLLNASHKSLSEDYQVTGEVMDALAEAGQKQEGVLGSRITGGGFGGCTVSLVKDQCIPAFQENVAREYEEKTGLKADFYVVEIGGGPVVY